MKIYCWLLLMCAGLLSGCVSTPPSKADDACQIFREKGGLLNNWYRHARRAERDFGVPVHVTMATIWQESRFQAKARPPRKKYMGFIPGRRPSSAYGYSQAKTETWRWYQEQTGRKRTRRSSFKHAAHFVGWYHHQTHRTNGVALSDAQNLYLAYHEGHGGFRRGTHRSKPWLLDVANRVQRQAKLYESQLRQCRRR